MPRPDLDERLHRSKLKRYLLADETPIVAQHQHWTALWRPIALLVGGSFVALAFDIVRPESLGAVSNVLWSVWLGLIGWLIWKWLVWWHEWLVATDKRLLVNYGLLNEGVSFINLSRVSDLTYTRSTLGKILGFGSLVRESAPRPGSLHEIKWVWDPHKTYLTICAAIFDLQDRMFGLDDESDGLPDDGPRPPAPRLNPRYAGKEQASPSDSPGEPDDEQAEDTAGFKIMYGGSRSNDREPPDLSEPSLREADTGPLPYRRSTTDVSAAWSPTNNDPSA